MATRKRKTPRTVAAYIASAKDNNAYIPSLKKYIRRKTLTRWEKAAITRAENKLGRKEYLYPLTKSQAKRLKDKTAIIGNGIRAIRLQNTTADTKVTIIKGELIIKSAGRTWRYIHVPVSAITDTAEAIYKRNPRTIMTLWLTRGRFARTVRSLNLFLEMFHSWLQQYERLDQFIQGLAYIA